jgi:addiction module HigA family antidote
MIRKGTEMTREEIVETLPPLHPGEVLREEFLEPLGLSAGKVAKACKVPRTRVERIVKEELGISGDTALRLARFFKTSPDFWMNLQCRYELRLAEQKVGAEVSEIRAFDDPALGATENAVSDDDRPENDIVTCGNFTIKELIWKSILDQPRAGATAMWVVHRTSSHWPHITSLTDPPAGSRPTSFAGSTFFGSTERRIMAATSIGIDRPAEFRRTNH